MPANLAPFPSSDQEFQVAPRQQVTLNLTPFDKLPYRKMIQAREETIRDVVTRVTPVLGLQNAIDVGAGVGFFSQTLLECGLHVCGIEGRAENVSEARKRFPHIPFEQADIQERSTLEVGKFDLVLCFGLLYHLENPLLAIRNLRALTGKCLLLAKACVFQTKSPPCCCVRSRVKMTRASPTWPAIPAKTA